MGNARGFSAAGGGSQSVRAGQQDQEVGADQGGNQGGQLVKSLSTLDIAEMGGRTIAARQRMQKVKTPGEWTEVEVHRAEYDIDVDAKLFTRANLRNPREPGSI